MLMKVRTGYAYKLGNKEFVPGDVVDLSEKEIQEFHWKLEPTNLAKEEPKAEEPKKEEPVLENRAILDMEAGAPIIRRGGKGRK